MDYVGNVDRFGEIFPKKVGQMMGQISYRQTKKPWKTKAFCV